MQKTCTSCNTVTQIPYIAHESIVFSLERHIKRLWVALIISLVCVLVMGVFCVYNICNPPTETVAQGETLITEE